MKTNTISASSRGLVRRGHVADALVQSGHRWVGLAILAAIALAVLPAKAQSLNMTLQKSSDAPNPLPSGQDFYYLITYSNPSTTKDARGVVITDALPSGIVYAGEVIPTVHIASYTTPASGANGTLTFTFVDPLPAGASGTLKIKARYPVGTTANGAVAVNPAHLTGSNVNSISANTTTTASAACKWVVNITGPSTAVLDQSATYAVRLDRPNPNAGNLDASSGTVTATLPVGVLAVDVTSADGGTVSGTGVSGDPVVVTWATGAFAASGTAAQAAWTKNLVVKFASARFTSGTQVTVTENASVTVLGGGNCGGTDTQRTTLNTFSASPNGSTAKTASDTSVIVGSQSFYWNLDADSTGNVGLDDFTLSDALPQHFALASVRMPTVNNGPGGNYITVKYQRSDSGATLFTWPGGPFAANSSTTLNVSALSLPVGVYVSYLQFGFGTVAANFGISTTIRVNGTLLATGWGSPATTINTGDTVCNTLQFSASYNGSAAFTTKTSQACVTATVPTLNPQTTKAVTSTGPYIPGGLITYQVETLNPSSSDVAMVNPMGVDLLPSQVDYVPGTFAFVTTSGANTAGAPDPTSTLQILPNQDGTGRTLLRWQYNASFAKNTKATVRFQARVKAGTLAGTINNRSGVIVDPAQQSGSVTYITPVTDTNDLDGDGNRTEQIGQDSANRTATVAASAALESSKLVKGALDTAYTRYPNYGFTTAGGAIQYRIRLFNSGNVGVNQMQFLDILPYLGDIGVVDTSPRLSAWTPELDGPIVVLVNGTPVSGTTVEYSTSGNPCRSDYVPSGPPGCESTAVWTATLPSPASLVRAFRITFPAAYTLQPGAEVTLEVALKAPLSVPEGTIAWNSFAYKATPVSGGLPTLVSEPIKVGVTVDSSLSVGNYVWVDENSDGYQDKGEPGIPNVRLLLYDDAGALISTTYTDATGHYLFPNLARSRYFVRVDESTLPAGMSQTTPSTIAGGDFGNQDPTTGAGDYGYFVTLVPGAANNPTADFGYNYNPTLAVNDPASLGVMDKACALGDRVWLDRNGDGHQDSDEMGVRGITLQIITAGPDGLFGTTDDVPGATAVTDANGRYLFDGLAPGAYVVEVIDDAGASHAVLGAGYTQTGDPDHFGLAGTGNDNVTTAPVVLGPGDVFLNADFGYQPDAGTVLGSIGDLVWLDLDASGGPVPTTPQETGIAGVSLALIRDTNGDGAWQPYGGDGIPGSADDEPIIATTTTDVSGRYGFAGLPLGDAGDGVPGNAHYLVWLNDTADVLNSKTETYEWNGTLDRLSAVVLSPAAPGNATLDFSFKPSSAMAGRGMIGDRVWFDANRNGAMDVGESGLGQVMVELLDELGNVTGSTITDPDGTYFFGGLEPTQAYGVRIAAANFLPGKQLAGMVNTFDPDGGNDGFNAGQNGGSTTVNLGAAGGDGVNDADGVDNGVNLGQDFGFGPPATAGSIGNQVWVDSNADGVRTPAGADGLPGTDDDEPALAGVTVDLYRDLNGNGRVDPGEPRLATTTTDANGQYRFTGLPLTDGRYDTLIHASDPDAAYVVVVSDRNGLLRGYWHSLGSQAQSADDASKTDPYAVILTATAPEVLTADFGYYVEPASLGNFVWIDTNGNGLQDDGEPGIAGVIVDLAISYPDGTVTVLKAKTDATGHYRFANLLQDEDDNLGTGAGQPGFVISVDPGQAALASFVSTSLNQGGDDQRDADDPAGVAAFPQQGLTDVSARTPSTLEPVIAGYDFGFRYVPTLAGVAGMEAELENGETVISWETSSEVGSVSFDIFRLTPEGMWQKVNAVPVLAENSSTGATYSIVDGSAVPPGPFTYRIVEWEDNGRDRVAGQFTLTIPGTAGTPPTAPRITAISRRGLSLEVSWSGGRGAWVLEHASSLGAMARWEVVNRDDPQVTRAELPLTGEAGYFRLRLVAP